MRGAHSLHLAAHDYLRAAWQLVSRLIDDARNFLGYAAKIATLHRTEDVDHRHNVVVRDNGHSRSALRRSEAREQRRRGIWTRSRDRHVCKTLERVDAVLRSLRGDLIADLIFRVDPEGWRGLKATAKRD